MNYVHKKCILFLSVICFYPAIWSMNQHAINGYDVESGDSEIPSSFSAMLEPINPVHRKYSPWTNFYTVAGGLIATGIVAPVSWHFAQVAGDSISDAMPVVAITGTFVASLGVCCYFLTRAADIVHTTSKKIITLVKERNSSEEFFE